MRVFINKKYGGLAQADCSRKTNCQNKTVFAKLNKNNFVRMKQPPSPQLRQDLVLGHKNG